MVAAGGDQVAAKVRAGSGRAMFLIYNSDQNGESMSGRKFVIVFVLFVLLAAGWILLGVPNF